MWCWGISSFSWSWSSSNLLIFCCLEGLFSSELLHLFRDAFEEVERAGLEVIVVEGSLLIVEGKDLEDSKAIVWLTCAQSWVQNWWGSSTNECRSFEKSLLGSNISRRALKMYPWMPSLWIPFSWNYIRVTTPRVQIDKLAGSSSFMLWPILHS